MKVAYVFNTSGRTATYKLGSMILPQLENGTLGAEVSAMLFFDDNNFILRKGDPIGERLAKVAAEKQILLISCAQCSMERGLSQGNCCGEDACTLNKPKAVDCIEGVACGCWADFFTKCKADGVDHIITL